MTFATWITTSRFLITILILLSFYHSTYDGYKYALCLLVIAVVTDVLDGFIARRMGQVSTIGAKLDPLVDKIMMHSLMFSLFYVGIYYPIIVFAIFFRDMIVDGLRNLIADLDRPYGSNFWGKAKFSLQALSAGCGLIYCMDSSYAELVWWANILLVIALGISLPGVMSVCFSLFSKRGVQLGPVGQRL